MNVIRYANSHGDTFTDEQAARLADHRRELNDDEVYEFTGFWEEVVAERTPEELAAMGVYVIAKREADQVVVAVDIEGNTPGHWLKIGFFVDGWMLGAPLPACVEIIEDVALDLGTTAAKAVFNMPGRDALVNQLRGARDTLEAVTNVVAAHHAGRWPQIPSQGELRAWCVSYSETPNEKDLVGRQ